MNAAEDLDFAATASPDHRRDKISEPIDRETSCLFEGRTVEGRAEVRHVVFDGDHAGWLRQVVRASQVLAETAYLTQIARSRCRSPQTSWMREWEPFLA